MIGKNFRAPLWQTKRQTGHRRTSLREENGRKTHAEPLRGGDAEAGGSWVPGTETNIEKHENRFADSERLEGHGRSARRAPGKGQTSEKPNVFCNLTWSLPTPLGGANTDQTIS